MTSCASAAQSPKSIRLTAPPALPPAPARFSLPRGKLAPFSLTSKTSSQRSIMSDFICPRSLNWSCILNSSSLPPPVLGGPVVPILIKQALVPAVIVGLEILFGRNPLLLLGELVNWPEIRPIPAIPAGEPREPGGALPDEQARIVWDADRGRAAIGAIGEQMEAWMAARISRSGRQERIFHSDSDSDSGYDSDASGSSSSGVVIFPSFHHLEVGAFTLIVPDSMAHLERILHSLPEGHHKETIMRACPRICNVLENALMEHIGSEASLDPYGLDNDSTMNWVLRLICTAIVCRVMWRELEGQNLQQYPDLKRECFLEVAGQSVKKLLDIASSFSEAGWSADHVKYMLPIFATLVEVLDYIKELPFSISDTVQDKVPDIYGKIVGNMCVIRGEIADDRCNLRENFKHPATHYLMQALKFFYDNKDMLQAVSGQYTYVLHDRWVLKLEEDAGRLFKNEKDQQYIFILNNMWFFYQRQCDPNIRYFVEQVKVDLVIQKYKEAYLGEFWVPLLTCKEGDSSRRRHCLSLDKFAEKYEKLCGHQIILKVLTELKAILIKEIKRLSRGPNGIFSGSSENESQTGRSSAERPRFLKRLMGMKQKSMTVEGFENFLESRFER